jgi:hypothetical protein
LFVICVCYNVATSTRYNWGTEGGVGVLGLLNKWFCHFLNFFWFKKSFGNWTQIRFRYFKVGKLYIYTHNKKKVMPQRIPFFSFLFYYFYLSFYFIFSSFSPSLSHSILVLVFMEHNNKGGNIKTCHCHHLSSKFSMSYIGNNNRGGGMTFLFIVMIILFFIGV